MMRVSQSTPSRITAAATAFAALVLAACGGGSAPAPAPAPAASAAAPAPSAAPAEPSAAAVAEAQQIFAMRCTPCHGPTGQGDGPASAGLVPPPRNFGDPAWQASVTDEHIEKIVMYGGVAVGKAPTMPPNPDLMSKSDVVKALRAHVRSLAQK